MKTLFATRAPYPKLISNTKRFEELAYLFFMDTSGIGKETFFDFHQRLRASVRFLEQMRDERGGNLHILFGTSFEDAIKSILVEEGADRLVLPTEERGAIKEELCEAVYV